MPRLPAALLTLALTLTVTLAPMPLRAQTASDLIDPYIRQLDEQGYDNLTIGTTWLGRIVISGIRDGTAREIVLNRRTGALLSDSALLPPASERLTMQPTSEDGGSGFGPPATTTVTVTLEGRGGELLDPGGDVGDQPAKQADR